MLPQLTLTLVLSLVLSGVSYAQDNECLIFYKKGKGQSVHLCAGDLITFSTTDSKGFTTSKILAVFKNHIKLEGYAIIEIVEIDRIKLRRTSGVIRLLKTGGANIAIAGLLFNLADATHKGFRWTATNTYVLVGGLVIGTSIILYPNYRNYTIGNKYKIRTSHY